ncbi:MAG TPA: toll/interleukin-1 receptor domain-containing protein [Pyrinomonadaceae bacterium]|jgi:tetratricopeptide (TPR) repeat protein
MSTETKPTVFISYSHKDEGWKNKLLPQLRALEQAGRIVVWHDRKIDGGDKWYPEIKEAMEQAAVAVCLISADFLSSDFCVKEEVPYLLQRCERDGMIFIPLLLRPCPWIAFPWLKEIQMLPRDGKSVAIDFEGREDIPFAELANRIFEIIDNPGYTPPAPPPPLWSLPEKLDIARLPATGAVLFGRQKEIELLDQAWRSDSTHIAALVAWGGVGKSTLVNKWLEHMKVDNYRGARRVYAWSFYSQGTGDRITSADQFISDALNFFGDPDPTAGSPWDKGERLASLVQREKTLLLLDGLEPLQSPHLHERGKIKDPALATLLTALARNNPGLCLITTREGMPDLTEFSDTVLQKDLERISDEAGRALLRVGGIQGTDAELEEATRDFGNHALAINLLASYLYETPGHHISHAAEIPDLDIAEAEGKHPRRIMLAFERRFGDSPEVELLRMLGLFDRPAEKAAMRALRRAPAIPGLSDRIRKLSEAGWLRVVEKLRHTKLIAPQSQHRPDDLDAHPLVREHFKAQLKQEHHQTWRAANSRLYEHYKRTTKVFPDTLEEMAPLYAAIAHGCEAGRHQETFNEVFYRRVLRGNAAFSIHNLGAFGAALTALSGFFDLPWQQPVSNLTEENKAFVLSNAGFALQALGQLKESTQPMQVGLEAYISHKQLKHSSIVAGNLSEIYLTIGDLSQAITYARQCVEFADQSDDRLQQAVVRATLANCVHQAGHLIEAEAAFLEAEKRQKEVQPEFSTLYSLWGFYYCEFLLDQGKYREVQARAKQNLTWITSRGILHDIAHACFSLGRASLLQAQREATNNFAEATDYLKRAVDGLRQAGTLNFLPSGLMGRAELYRVTHEFESAQADLDEALSIAKRGNMGLHEADCHLEYARLYLAQDEKEKARASWETAREMIGRMGYHRRDRDVEEIGRELGEAEG